MNGEMNGERISKKRTGLDWSPYGDSTSEQGESMPGVKSKTRADFGRISEISNEELEKQLPTWVVETNRFENDLAMASLRSALSADGMSDRRTKRSS
jgi:hypothetical protein